MAEEKTIRLSKATKELGVGLDHIVEFLSKNGIKLDKNPNAKITTAAYGMLQSEFQQDKEIKKVAEEITKEKFRKENIVIEAPPTDATAPETVPDEPKDTLVEDLISIKQQAVEKARRKTKKTKEAEGEEKPKKVARTKAVAPAAATDEAAESEEKKPKKTRKVAARKEAGEEAAVEEAPKKKTRKKETAEPAAEVPEPETAEVPPPVAEAPAEETPQAAAPAETPPAPEAAPPAAEKDAPYRTERSKLSGPTILGKIELPADSFRKKPGGTADDDSKLKKKRKRTDKKVNISKQIESGAQDTRPTEFRPGSRTDGRGGRGKRPAPELSDKEIHDQIKATLARLSGGKKKGRPRKRGRGDVEKKQATTGIEQTGQKTIKVTEFVSANELAKLIGVPVNEIISKCMQLGMFVSINQRLDAETLSVVAGEFNCKVEFVSADVTDAIQDMEDMTEELVPRAPIVTVMGHVDHGKTSLLDYIRKANVIAGEAGGITQHIGAYEVTLENGKQIAFLDTPGHEAFTAMRARGAQLTDVAIIVIAADDDIMPQTREAINHAQAAGVPIVFAINKVDKPDANPEKIKEGLSKMNILVEDWGGKYQSQAISAKTGAGVHELLEKVLLEAEILDLKANPDRNARGTVIESSLDKGRGFVSTVLVQTGTLRMGDVVLAGCFSGRVKAMFNERGHKLDEAGPSSPAMILGLSGAAQAGDQFNVLDDEREAREIATRRLQLQREQGIRTTKHITLDEIGRRLAIGSFKELNIIVKGDVDGSIEAMSDSLLKLSTPEIQVNVIHKSVGAITETDVMLASASNAIIIGFQVRPSLSARKLAEHEQIDIRLYSIIYDAINEVKDAMEGMLAPEYEEKITCNLEVRDIFKIPKVGTVAGCMVQDGKITRNTHVRVIRDGIVAFTGELASLKRFKDDAREVQAGMECGLSIENFNDVKVGDIIEGYEQVAVKRTLA